MGLETIKDVLWVVRTERLRCGSSPMSAYPRRQAASVCRVIFGSTRFIIPFTGVAASSHLTLDCIQVLTDEHAKHTSISFELLRNVWLPLLVPRTRP